MRRVREPFYSWGRAVAQSQCLAARRLPLRAMQDGASPRPAPFDAVLFQPGQTDATAGGRQGNFFAYPQDFVLDVLALSISCVCPVGAGPVDGLVDALLVTAGQGAKMSGLGQVCPVRIRFRVNDAACDQGRFCAYSNPAIDQNDTNRHQPRRPDQAGLQHFAVDQMAQ